MKNQQTQKHRGFTFVEFLVVVIIIVALIGFIFPDMMIDRNKQAQVTAVSNARQLYFGLVSFDTDYGSFPDDQKAARYPALAGFTGNTSNKLLGQLIASGLVKDEKIFYAKGGSPSGNIKPDGRIDPKSEILKAGECGYAYVMVSLRGLERRGLSTCDNGGIPVLITPAADNQGTFKPDPYQGKGIYLTLGGSVKSQRINQTKNKLKLPSGKTLLETGNGTVWGDLTPIVLLPE